jgi:hypothetical protein
VLASAGLALVAIILRVATARMFVRFAEPQLNPRPLWVPVVGAHSSVCGGRVGSV